MKQVDTKRNTKQTQSLLEIGWKQAEITEYMHWAKEVDSTAEEDLEYVKTLLNVHIVVARPLRGGIRIIEVYTSKKEAKDRVNDLEVVAPYKQTYTYYTYKVK